MTSDFSLYPLRVEMTARDELRFTGSPAGNMLRGAFGTVLRAWDQEVYERLFEPPRGIGGPSGVLDRPRPFRFRAGHLDGKTIREGERFGFDFLLFDTRAELLQEVKNAFAEIALEGLGARRSRLESCRVMRLDGEHLSLTDPPLELSLGVVERGTERVVVEFQTATELKRGGAVVTRPEFEALFARVRDRVGTLRAFYGGGELDVDYRGLAERARQVEWRGGEWRGVEARRRSSRTGQEHALGGFVGWAEYAGEFDEFLPWLRIAEWTGVGRQTSWGKGQIRVRLPVRDGHACDPAHEILSHVCPV